VTIVETNTNTSMTCMARLRAVASSQKSGQIRGLAQDELMRTLETSGLGVSHASGYVAIKGTSVSAIAARKATALLPISDAVVFDGLAGIRTWDPPV
jgi:hypothetical protein